MPINTTYPGYDNAMKKVTRVRDFNEGSDAVKAKGEAYLPKLGGQSQEDYDAYKLRGYLVPAVSPTQGAITGSVMRKPAMINSGSLSHIEDDINNGVGVNDLVENMISEFLLAGGVGYLVEYTDKVQVKAYTRENIINFSSDYIVLKQMYVEQDPKDKFIQEYKTEYLELTFDEQGNYIQNIWRATDGEKFDIYKADIMPTNRQEPLKEIPFVYASPNGESIPTSDPLLLQLANVNLDQYLLSTDHRHGLHWTALPTLFLFGDLRDQDGNKKPVKVGAGTANHIDDTDARAELLEFTGQGLGAIKSAVDDDTSTMASIGAKMLSNDSGGVEAAETARINASSETATLSVIANAVDAAMAELLAIIGEWSSVTGLEYKVNRDFIDIKLDPQALLALLQTWQSGGMSLNSFLYQLEKGELLPPKVSAEEEAGRIDTTGMDFEE